MQLKMFAQCSPRSMNILLYVLTDITAAVRQDLRYQLTVSHVRTLTSVWRIVMDVVSSVSTLPVALYVPAMMVILCSMVSRPL
mgnify:FL=1